MAANPTLFCHTLRRRPSYAAAVPKLLSQSQFPVREELLNTHDIAVPISAAIHPQSGHLRCLLLSASAVSDTKKGATLERVQHFACLTDESIAIVFLLNPPRDTSFQSAKNVVQAAEGAGDNATAATLAYTKLQIELMNLPDLPCIPIFPLHSLDGLQSLLQQRAARHNDRRAIAPRNMTTARDLMQLCSLGQPMKGSTADILSDTFVNLRDMVEAMVDRSNAPNSSSPTAAAHLAWETLSRPVGSGNENGRLHISPEDNMPHSKLEKLATMISAEEMADLVEFWRNEWQL